MNDNSQIIISAPWIIPVESTKPAGEELTVLEQCALLIREGVIEAIDSKENLIATAPDAKHHNLDNHVLAPGLINAHGHAAMTLLRGYADDYPLMSWLEQHIWPAEGALVSHQFVADGTELAIAEMLLSGTTCFSDMYFFPDAAAASAEKLGIRAQISFPILEIPSAWANSADEYLAKGTALIDEYRHSPLIEMAFGPHAPYTVANSSFEKIAMLAEEIDSNIQVHLHETAVEIQQSIEKYGCTPLQRLMELGVCNARTQAVHMTQLDEDDLATLCQSGASVIHCPSSNLKLASGYCPVTDLLGEEIRVGLGTDGAASNNSLDLLGSAREAALLAKHIEQDASALSASQALRMATLGGAEALSINHLVGSLEVGKQADIIAIDCSHPAMQPLYSPVSQLVYTLAGAHVSHVWVAGELKVDQQQLVDIDLESLSQRSNYWRSQASALRQTR